jgi:hypothetical protein
VHPVEPDGFGGNELPIFLKARPLGGDGQSRAGKEAVVVLAPVHLVASFNLLEGSELFLLPRSVFICNWVLFIEWSSLKNGLLFEFLF